MSNFSWIFLILLVYTGLNQIKAAEPNCITSETELICNKKFSKFCTCTHQLITCDFRNYKAQNRKQCLKLERGWEKEKKDVKRMCFCGGAHDVDYFFSSNLTDELPILQRIDFYDIPGIIHLNKTFGSNFAGDIYMSGVRVNTIHAYEFQKDNKMDLEDVSGIECCSKIPRYHNVTHPLLSIQNSSLGLIKSNGIKDDDKDQWRTVFFANVEFKGIQKEGIVFDQPGLNISIVGCRFNYLNNYAINIINASNIFFAKNSLHLTITTLGENNIIQEPAPLQFNSGLPESNILMIENYFNNEIQFFLQAEKVYIWFNRFDVWYNRTFSHLLLRSGKTPSFFSVAWNAINTTKYLDLSTLPKPVIPDEKSMYFLNNVLGPCNCENSILDSLPSQLQDSMCELTGDISNICRIKVAYFLNKYCQSTSPKPPRCGIFDGERSLVLDFPYLLETYTFKNKTTMKSNFMDTLVNDLYPNYYYAIPPMIQTEPNETALLTKRNQLNKISVFSSSPTPKRDAAPFTAIAVSSIIVLMMEF